MRQIKQRFNIHPPPEVPCQQLATESHSAHTRAPESKSWMKQQSGFACVTCVSYLRETVVLASLHFTPSTDLLRFCRFFSSLLLTVSKFLMGAT